MDCPKAATWVSRNLAHPVDSGLPKPDYVWRNAHESPLLALVSPSSLQLALSVTVHTMLCLTESEDSNHELAGGPYG
jgi:hypothetical protein